MIRLAALSIAAVAALSACTMTPEQAGVARADPYIVPQELPYRPGTGVVQSVRPAPAPLSAAAGSSAPSGNRLNVRMDDGRMLIVDTDSSEFQAGSRIRLTENRMIEKP